MAFGSYEAPEVLELRKFRDNVLANSFLGRAFIKAYYAASPRLVVMLENCDSINRGIRTLLRVLIKVVK